jgi:hypothetical protein
MQEKRNKRLVFSLVILLACIAVISFWTSDNDRNFSLEKDLYSNIDLKSVDRVVLKGPEGLTELRFQGYRWKVNDSIDADRGLIEVLFATLQQAQPRRPVASSLRDSVIRDVTTNGVNVSLFAGPNKLKSFFAGGNDAKTQAIFVPDNGKEAHLMIIPGYRVYVSGIFEVPAIGWREKLIFNFNWQNFAKLEARYKNPAGNFDVGMQKNQVFIPQVAEVDTARLNSYLDQVSLLTVEEYISPNKMTDSLSATQPILNLTVIDIANRHYNLSVFASGKGFYARVNQKNWAILQENRIIPVLRPKDFFIKR